MRRTSGFHRQVWQVGFPGEPFGIGIVQPRGATGVGRPPQLQRFSCRASRWWQVARPLPRFRW
eukprot:11185973-Lingulodinium_polyedra.AAC.1